MIDTNVVLDMLLDRAPFADTSCEVLSLCENHHLDGFVTASTVTDIFYIVRKYTHSTETAYKAIGKLLEIVKVCPVTNNDILVAYEKRAKDFEDCLLAVCAKSNGCGTIISRNEKDFGEFDVEAVAPKDFLREQHIFD